MAYYRAIPIFPPSAPPQMPSQKPIVQRMGQAQTNNNSDVPDNILKFNGPGTVQVNKQSVSDAAQSSSFLITVNPNASYKIIVTEEQKANLYRALRAAMNRLGSGFQTKEVLKPFPSVNPQPVTANVKQYEFNIENGNKAGFMHVHAILILDGKCHIDLKKAQTLLDAELGSYHEPGQHVYLNIRSFKDQKSVIEAYLKKSQEANEIRVD